jgi:hypothetical protein
MAGAWLELRVAIGSTIIRRGRGQLLWRDIRQ